MESAKSAYGQSFGSRELVLHVARPAAGGLRRHLLALIPELQSLGCGCAVAASSDVLDSLQMLSMRSPIELVPLEIADRPSVGADLRACRALRAVVRTTGPGILHAHGIRAGWITVLARLEIPAVVTVHNLYTPPRNPLAAVLSTLALRKADYLIAVSQAVAETLIRGGLARDRIRVVPNGLTFPRPDPVSTPSQIRARLGVASDAPLVVCVARLMPDKGVDTLIRAWPKVVASQPAARCLIAGDGPDRSALEGLARQTSGVSLLGFFDDVFSLYAAADVVAIPSRREGQSIVCLEAMASNPPPAVLAFRVGGLPEMVQDCVTGRLARPDDPGAWAAALLEMLQDPAGRTRMAEAAAELVRGRYTAQAMAKGVLAVYTALQGDY